MRSLWDWRRAGCACPSVETALQAAPVHLDLLTLRVKKIKEYIGPADNWLTWFQTLADAGNLAEERGVK